MRKSENHPLDIRTNNIGATHDVSPELSGAENKGTYYDSENGRVTSDRGNEGAWEKIRGEELVHSTFYPGDWFCMCSIPVNNDIFEIWVEKNGADSPYIVVNGIVMGKSSKMPWLYEYRIQFDKNESCLGGEVFLTDNNTFPIIFNIKDIIDNYNNGTLVYFDDFNLNLYGIGLTHALDIPVFEGLVDVGSGGGLKNGSYQYSIRYINESGDATNWSPLTPPIPVIERYTSDSPQYPYAMTIGGPVGQQTKYGVKLKFRVTNLNNYDFLEIRRISYNEGLNIDVVPAGVLVAKIDISPGEVSIHRYVDPIDSNIDNELIDASVEAGQLAAISKAKAIRYYDKRVVLMNIGVTSKDTSDVNIIDYNGKKIFPIVENLGKSGFKNPVNHTYKKNYQSNEKYSFGINFFDGYGGSGFVLEDNDLKNVESPSRRAEMSQDSIDLSYGGSVTAASVNSNVVKTFEVFSHENAIKKTDKCSFKNIMEKGSKSDNTVNAYCADAGFGSVVKSSEVGYEPYHPVNQDDTNSTGHNYRVNTKVYNSAGDEAWYDPKGFGCDYYTRGFAFSGVENLPAWIKAFSVVRSERAGRVICQGIGTYSLDIGNVSVGFSSKTQAKKSKNKILFNSPDLISGKVTLEKLADIRFNPNKYEVIFSSPLGFFSEVYGFRNEALGKRYSTEVDLIAYARILRDNGQLNPNEDPLMGIGGYVAYNRYRNVNDNAGQGAFNTPLGGEKIFSLVNVSPKADTYKIGLELTLGEDIYNQEDVNGIDNNDFDNSEMKAFTEPFYIVNIIQKGKIVQDLNINSYYGTGHYQKVESVIGIGNGNDNQSFELVDERWEDCIPSLSSTGFNNNGESFIYIANISGIQKAYFNVTYKTPAEISTIINDITLNGFYTTPNGTDIYGIYTHSYSSGVFNINFNYPISNPDEGFQIIVKYDKTRPIRFFGGDTTIDESVCPIQYRKGDNTGVDTSLSKSSNFDIAFPYRAYEINPRVYLVKHTTGLNKIQDDLEANLGEVKQLEIMFATENQSAFNYSFKGNLNFKNYLSSGGADNPFAINGNFPLYHYVIHPYGFKNKKDKDNIYNQYYDDFSISNLYTDRQGFIHSYGVNTDYTVKGPILYFSKPDVGFKEETDFCTGIAWSLPRFINQQNSPGLKTFLSTNRFYLSDDNGEIKKAWDARTDGKGDNLYAITKSGIALLVTKKAILSNITADDLTVTAVDSFISQEYWLSQDIGSDGEMWRGMADSSVEIRTEIGKVLRESLFIPNRNSIYRLMNNTIVDILKNKYYSRIHPNLQNIKEDYTNHLVGHFDITHNEYWLQMDDNKSPIIKNRCFVYSQDTNHFIGTFDYSFDKYMSKDSKNYGFRDGKMFELDKGFIINGDIIESKLIQHTSTKEIFEKEFITIEVNTGVRKTMKPTIIKIKDENLNLLTEISEAKFGQEYLKQYDGWWAQIPRKDMSVDIKRGRIQYRLILLEIIHKFEEDFKIVSSVIQYKHLK